ncbi:MAG: C-terminal binding protein [Chloroflexi bacterium]|nr:C-terminal binding protein [Chloroflexota bacterium]
MPKYRVVVVDRTVMDVSLERHELAAVDCEVVPAAVSSEGELIEAVADADVVLDSALPMPRRVIESMRHGRLIVRMGHGYEGIDIPAANEKGIMVANVAGSTSEEVSNHALALMLSCGRRLHVMDRGVRAGKWRQLWSREIGGQLWDETVGILGFGHIGRAFARKANALRMRVIAHDPWAGPWVDLEEGVNVVSFDQLLRESDYITIHCNYGPQSHHAFDAQAFRKMKPTAYLINTARGPVVDEKALIEALRSGQIAGAGLDVFEKEPPEPDNPLLKMENVILSPHIAGSSPGGWARIRRGAARDAARALQGLRPHSLVNPEVLVKLGMIEGTLGGRSPA